MTADQLLALVLFAAVTSITPGPNNMMIMASGLNFGFARSLPHLLGISLGFGFMLVATGWGLHTVLQRVPGLETAMRYGGAAYLLWMAWQIARAAPLVPGAGAGSGASGGEGSGSGSGPERKPLGFWGAAAFQWINPKAWVMAVTAATTYSAGAQSDSGIGHALLLALVFVIVGAPCVTCWALFGSAMRRVLQDPKSVRLFNWGAAALLVASLYPVFF